MIESLAPIVSVVQPYAVAIIKGFGAGAGAALIGYAKNKGEEFDGQRFLKTVVVGGATGAVAEAVGLDPTSEGGLVVYPFVVYVANAITNAVYRRVLAPLAERITK